MKHFVAVGIACGALAMPAGADILAQWNFNDNSTNNHIPASTGTGTATLVGGTTATFAGGSTTDSGSPNNGWNTTTYPAQGQGNKTRGVQFTVDTTGFDNIGLSWEHRLSNTASKYARVQYSTNGIDFVDSGVVNIGSANNFFSQTNSFSGIVAVDNVATLTIRIATEWQSTATGSGADNYVTVSGTTAYGSGGTVRLDLFTIHGEPATGNMPPSISAISNQVIRVNTSTTEIPFTVADAETPLDSLTVIFTSSNQSLVPDGNILQGGSGANRTVQVVPSFDQTGTATISAVITDGGGKSAVTMFTVTVLPDNTTPTISSIAPVNGLAGAVIGPVSFTIGDLESNADELEVSASSSNPELLSDQNISLGGSGANRTVTLMPLPDRSGVAVVTITVGDISLSTNTSFAVLVVPSSAVLLCDNFSYSDGPIINVSGGLWHNHSGTIAQMVNSGGKLNVLSTQLEDVNAPLLGGPYTMESGVKLYAKFTLNVSTMPTTEYGNYFAHFKDNTAAGFTTRVFAQTHDAAPGMFRLAIANRTSNATNATQLPSDLSPNTDYTVVTRYDTVTGLSTLWVNPALESDPNVTGSGVNDSANFLAISTYAFRESTDFGQLTVDDLKVATSFGALLGYPSLRIERGENAISVSWPADAMGWDLQASPALGSEAGWQAVPDAPSEIDGRKVVTFAAPAGIRFFRLSKPGDN